MESDRVKREKIVYNGPNLFLFSLALLLSIFAAYSVGVLVTKKADEKRENNIEKVEISNTEDNNYKSIVSGKSYINSKKNILYFYDDNTYYLKIDSLGEYGTYEVNKDEVTIYNLFSIDDNFNNFNTLSGKETIKIDNNYLIITTKDSDGNNVEDKYELESSNINSSMSDILSKIQKVMNNK